MTDSSADSTTQNTNEAELVLDEPSMESWAAYNAMFESKQRHYDLLQIMEDKKKKFNLNPTDAEKAQLADCLTDHDVRVQHFITVSQQLKLDKPESHELLFKFIGQLGDGVPSKKTPH